MLDQPSHRRGPTWEQIRDMIEAEQKQEKDLLPNPLADFMPRPVQRDPQANPRRPVKARRTGARAPQR